MSLLLAGCFPCLRVTSSRVCVSSDFVIACWALWVADCRATGSCYHPQWGPSCFPRRLHEELVTLNSYGLGVGVVCVGMETAAGFRAFGWQEVPGGSVSGCVQRVSVTLPLRHGACSAGLASLGLSGMPGVLTKCCISIQAKLGSQCSPAGSSPAQLNLPMF